MQVLFAHAHCPAQYRHLAAALAAEAGNRVVFLTRDGGADIPGVQVRRYAPHRDPRPDAHPYLKATEAAVLQGQAAWRAATALKAEGFRPDVMCAHAGFGPGLYLKDVFPDTPLLTYFEWYYRAVGSDADFLLGPLSADDACRLRTLNAGLLVELSSCDWGVCPTAFQRSQFPGLFQGKLTTIHDGIDTDEFSPGEPGSRRIGPLGLSEAGEIVTYATRGMDPYRGFPQMLRAAVRLLADRPGLHVVVAGDDEVNYGPRRPDGRSWKQAMLDELGGRPPRLHFVGCLPRVDYRRLLRLSTVHVYLTVPFVLSWSLLEAMAVGCAIVASDTAPVREVMTDGGQGLLVPFQDVAALADRVARLLDDAALRQDLAVAARGRILAGYRLADLLPRQLRLVRHLAETAGSAGIPDALRKNL